MAKTMAETVPALVSLLKKGRFSGATVYCNYPPLTTNPGGGEKCYMDEAITRIVQSYTCQHCRAKGAMGLLRYSIKPQTLVVHLFCRQCARWEE